MAANAEDMRSDVSFHRVLHSHSRGTLGPRIGRATVKKANGTEIRIDTPGIVTSTSRGVVPHLTQDHVAKTDAIKWVHLPFETFLERNPPLPTLIDGGKPLQRIAGLREDKHVLSMSLRDPHDVREMPPNGTKFVNANCIRGVRKMSPEQYRFLVQTCNPDIVIALSDTPFTAPPFSRRRITKSLERSTAWLAATLHPSSGVARDRHHPFNIFMPMVGDVNESARRAFALSLTEKLSGKEAEQVKPFKCLDDAILGYVFDLVPLRTSLLAIDKSIVEEEEVAIPIRRAVDSKPLTHPQSETILPQVVELLRASLEPLSPEKPRLATGASSPHEVLHLIRNVGIDLFGIAWAQKAADWGIALDFMFPLPLTTRETSRQNLREDGKRNLGHNLYSPQYARDFSRIADTFLDGASQTENSMNICPCLACSPVSSPTELTHASIDVLTRAPTPDDDEAAGATPAYNPPFTRAYIHHLLHTHEMSAHALLAAHNLAVADAFFTSIRRVLASGAPHTHHPHAHSHGTFHPDVHPSTEPFIHPPDSNADFTSFEEEVERFCATYDGTLRIFGEAKRDWITVDYARGKGRLAREKAKQGEEDLATRTEKNADIDELARNSNDPSF